METSSRIPELTDVTFDGALTWFSELQCRGILFSPEDDPADIICIADDTRVFTTAEVADLRDEIAQLELALTHDVMVEAAYSVFMNAMGQQLDS